VKYDKTEMHPKNHGNHQSWQIFWWFMGYVFYVARLYSFLAVASEFSNEYAEREVQMD
jgi:hypothetical protein